MWIRKELSKTRNLVKVESTIAYGIYQWQNTQTEKSSTHIYVYIWNKNGIRYSLFHTKPLNKELLEKLEQNRDIKNLLLLLEQYNKIKKEDIKIFITIKSLLNL